MSNRCACLALHVAPAACGWMAAFMEQREGGKVLGRVGCWVGGERSGVRCIGGARVTMGDEPMTDGVMGARRAIPPAMLGPCTQDQVEVPGCAAAATQLKRCRRPRGVASGATGDGQRTCILPACGHPAGLRRRQDLALGACRRLRCCWRRRPWRPRRGPPGMCGARVEPDDERAAAGRHTRCRLGRVAHPAPPRGEAHLGAWHAVLVMPHAFRTYLHSC